MSERTRMYLESWSMFGSLVLGHVLGEEWFGMKRGSLGIFIFSTLTYLLYLVGLRLLERSDRKRAKSSS